MLDRARHLPVAGDIDAELPKVEAVAAPVVGLGLFVSLRERLHNLRDVALIDRARVMQARHDGAQRHFGRVIHGPVLRDRLDNVTIAEAGRESIPAGGGLGQ